MSEPAVSKFRSRGFLLLSTLVLMILISPLFEGSLMGSFANTGLYTVVLMAVVYGMSESQRVRLIALVWALLAIVLLWWDAADRTSPVHIAGLVVFVVLNSVAIILVFRRIFQDEAVTFDTICHAVALYLLLGVTFALTYFIVNLAITESFADLPATVDSGWTSFLYFSFATLTTLGYGDVTPDLPFVKIWAVMEAVVGVLYIAILVARLVSLYRR